ncbi:energy transducer TonB [Flavicella sp.]|uniref:energy transducer TonB n=1 Tax=Flavicella sp. TaxID=2957742 RepID=UPI0026149B50|nr:energy transducer TonB [Flavicella sp.]MDG1806028.1 energy transducer TonB [Flavicella sp.]
MKYLETKHKQKSAVITLVLMTSILMLMLFFGMRYMDPPEEYGIAINFGTSEVGNGPPKVQETVKSAPVPEQPQQETLKEVETPVEEIQEEVLTQNTEEAPVIQKKETVKKPAPTPVEKPKEVKKPVVKEAPKPSKETENALSNLLNGNPSDGDVSQGEGDDDQSGLKGNELGDPNSSKYYGNGGSGGDGNYSLSGRTAVGKPKISSDCNVGGTVVVSIQVDRSGKVINATPGAKGTTESSPCLYKAAKEAALKTKWSAAPDAPSVQKGRIIYHFSLSE